MNKPRNARIHRVFCTLGALALVIGVSGATTAEAQVRRAPARDYAAEAQLQAAINQLIALTRAEQVRQAAARPIYQPGISGPQAGQLGGVQPFQTRPATAADIARGTGLLGGTPMMMGNNPGTYETLMRHAPGAVNQMLGSQNDGIQRTVAPTCYPWQYRCY